MYFHDETKITESHVDEKCEWTATLPLPPNAISDKGFYSFSYFFVNIFWLYGLSKCTYNEQSQSMISSSKPILKIKPEFHTRCIKFDRTRESITPQRGEGWV